LGSIQHSLLFSFRLLDRLAGHAARGLGSVVGALADSFK
jgi:hypothetical protein